MKGTNAKGHGVRMALEPKLSLLSSKMLGELAKSRGLSPSSAKGSKKRLITTILNDVVKEPDKPLRIKNKIEPKPIKLKKDTVYSLKSPGMKAFKPKVVDRKKHHYEIEWVTNPILVPLVLDLAVAVEGPLHLGLGIDLGDFQLEIPSGSCLVSDYNWISCGSLKMHPNSKLIGLGEKGLTLDVRNGVISNTHDKSKRPLITTSPHDIDDGVPFNPEYRILLLSNHPEPHLGARGDTGTHGQWPTGSASHGDDGDCWNDAEKGGDAPQNVQDRQHGGWGKNGEYGRSGRNLTINTPILSGSIKFSSEGSPAGKGGQGGSGMSGKKGGTGGWMSWPCRKPGKGGRGGPGGDGGRGGDGGKGGDAGNIVLNIDNIETATHNLWVACAKGGAGGESGSGGKPRTQCNGWQRSRHYKWR